MDPVATIETLDYWYDAQDRSGPENMAVDQLLMERVGENPLLRVYGWSEPTVSFGYFLSLASAQKAFPDKGLRYVRRWTGGGVVDHRIDVTYTLVIPRGHRWASARGAESYRLIHQALADTLIGLGEVARVTVVDEGDGGCACFTNPVAYDLTGEGGRKIAGAGQRRTRYGLLHQGSLLTQVNAALVGKSLASTLAQSVLNVTPDISGAAELATERYATDAWLRKR